MKLDVWLRQNKIARSAFAKQVGLSPASVTTLCNDPAAWISRESAERITACVRDAGIVGAGGAGFPTYVKLQAKAEIYLVNAAECEPMLKVDQQLMARQAAELVRGLRYGMAATGAREGIIALKAKYQPAIAALNDGLRAQFDPRGIFARGA